MKVTVLSLGKVLSIKFCQKVRIRRANEGNYSVNIDANYWFPASTSAYSHCVSSFTQIWIIFCFLLCSFSSCEWLDNTREDFFPRATSTNFCMSLALAVGKRLVGKLKDFLFQKDEFLALSPVPCSFLLPDCYSNSIGCFMPQSGNLKQAVIGPYAENWI